MVSVVFANRGKRPGRSATLLKDGRAAVTEYLRRMH